MTIMGDEEARKTRLKNARIKAVKAAKKLPTALLLQRKVECDAKALKIVMRLIETQVDEGWMLENLSQINRSHLEDVIEERAIVELCGYVLCDNVLTKIVNKQYKISTLRNKVYDVQKTKNFCSFWCYTASEYLLEQMLTSPLWLRADEEIPVFLKFDKPKDRMKNPPGVEVNIVGLELPSDGDLPSAGDHPSDGDLPSNGDHLSDGDHPSDEDHPSDKDHPSDRDHQSTEDLPSDQNPPSESNESTNKKQDVDLKACNEVTINLLKPNHEERKESTNDPTKNSEKSLEPLENPNKSEKPEISQLETSEKEIPTTTLPKCSDTLNPENLQSTAPAEKPDRRRKSEFTKNTEKQKKLKKRPSVSFASLTARVEQSLTEWVTKHTIDLLRGDASTKQRLLETLTLEDRHGALIKKLNTIQLEESKEDRVSAIQSTVLQPAPHFSVLKEEAEALEVKVRAFYDGSTAIPPVVTEKKEEEENDDKVVPLTPAHAPIALRRRIFLDKLNKVLPDLLRTLSGPGQYQHTYTPDKTAKVKALVSTFKLSATNIVFKTAEWTLVAFLIIKILSVIDDNIKNLLETKQATMYTAMILMSYQLDSSYLDRLVGSLTMVEKLDSDDDDDL